MTLDEIKRYHEKLPDGLRAKEVIGELIFMVEYRCLELVRESWVKGRSPEWEALDGAAIVVDDDDDFNGYMRYLYSEAERKYPKLDLG